MITAFTTGLLLNGMAAPMLRYDPVNGPTLLASAEQVFAPELGPNDSAVMDNQISGVREAVEKVGAQFLFLSAILAQTQYHLDGCLQAQALIGTAAARTVDELRPHVADCPQAFTSVECRRCWEATGYDPE